MNIYIVFSAFVVLTEGCLKSKTFWIEVDEEAEDIGESSDDYFSTGSTW